MTSKSVCFPSTNISVTVLVLAFSLTVRLSLDKVTFVDITRRINFGSFASCKTVSPVTIVVATILVGKFAFTVIEVIKEATFVNITVVLEALALAIAFAGLELSFSNITIVVSHLTPTGHGTFTEVSFI